MASPKYFPLDHESGAARADLADDGEDQALAATPSGRRPVISMPIVFGFDGALLFIVAKTCSTCRPDASANAPKLSLHNYRQTR